MTFTVDDLVSSFNTGGHIGQEAIDIANLQAQLAQTLAYAQQQQQFASSSHRLCNTPTTARTPTTSFGNWSAFEQHQHRARSRSASIAAEGGGMETLNEDTEMDMDEEFAVEQLLEPAHAHILAQPSPVEYRGRGDSILAQQNSASNHSYAYPTPSPNHSRYPDSMSFSDPASPVFSNFAASDPFAVAAAESAHQSQQAHSSFFAQIGRPSQHSPFYAAGQTNAGSTPSQNHFSAPRFIPAGTVDS